MTEHGEVWVLGATGRTGSRVARSLADRGVRVVLVGRDAARLDALAHESGAARTIVAADVPAMARLIRAAQPAVVVNTVGPFAETAGPIAEACLPGSSYADLANDAVAAAAILALHDRAVDAGRTLITGAGFGVVGTEGPLTTLCAGRPVPQTVRVDGMASLAMPASVMGDALAGTIVDAFADRARRVTGGHTVRTGMGSHSERVPLPDGSHVSTGAWGSGDLITAQRVSRAREVIAASTEVPTAAAVRAFLPLARWLLSIGPLRRLAAGQLAKVRAAARPMPRSHTWGRARVEWADGSVRTAWLKAGDAFDFTAEILSESAHRILDHRARAGAGTPVELLGLDLIDAAGGELSVDG
ncbi:saccharopine dehydrogenase NADP-binding domain-containing protein [Homoserinibacter sp. YIM 151385]|uniref:saccharopine dehydrogenase NADP-binding domain-containing protein n=1 Tax=Homoserinibacter sp. YIM 151385 TaxID=2985506 RepID=UPI0022F12BD5|nr:saccharopine dehydrogenase NADP-binding domain-containing protein [Homoserinibacter sp. YIM 151385]WBU38023.1 saccharopine dehydrogenase NADP-binding domain-containing protein [Homoserinibacter sp. YIM 151385]